jgi:putative hydrolase of the HAD superfamily
LVDREVRGQYTIRNAMSIFRAVFFDFGGTLFSYASFQRAMRDGDGEPIFVRAAERLGVEVDRRSMAKAYAKASRMAFQKYNDRSYYLHRDLFVDTFVNFAIELGAEADESFVEWFYDLQRETLLESFELRADCISTLETLRDDGLSLHIVSNIDDDYLHPMVACSGLDAVLDHWTSSEEAGSCKPHRRFFERALEKAGLEASDVLFVGDSPAHDVAGAKQVGMRAALLLEAGAEPPGQFGKVVVADYEIHALAELIPICRA